MKQYLALVLLLTTVAIAQPGRFRGPGQPPMAGREQVIERLNLTDDQEDQFKQLRSDFQKKNIELMAKVKTQRLTLRDLFDDDRLDQDKIESAISGISKTQNELKLNKTTFWFNVNKILKPDQQKMWKHHAEMMMKQQMQHRMMNGRGMGRPGMEGMRQHRQHWGSNEDGCGNDDDVTQDDADTQDGQW